MKRLGVFLCVALVSSSFLVKAEGEVRLINLIIETNGDFETRQDLQEAAKNADINLIVDVDGEKKNAVMTALSLPRSYVQDTLENLVRYSKKAIDCSKKNNDGDTPLMIAIKKKYKDVINYLLDSVFVNDADLELKDKDEKRPFDLFKQAFDTGTSPANRAIFNALTPARLKPAPAPTPVTPIPTPTPVDVKALQAALQELTKALTVLNAKLSA